MPRKPTRKTGPMTAAQRMREKRARDREIVWDVATKRRFRIPAS